MNSIRQLRLYRYFTMKTILPVVFMAFLSTAYSQYELDALRFSRLNPSGTARYTSMGGAMGALGGDFSVISTNPAGLGLFRHSQVTVSPSLYVGTTASDYEGNRFKDDRFNFNLGNLGLLFKIRYNKTKTKGIQFLNLAIGYNRINNFNSSLYFQAENDQHSLAEVFKNNAQGVMPGSLDPFTELLAFNTYLIDTAGGPANYFSNGPYPGENKVHSLQITRKGSGGEFTLGAGLNISNMFFLGASVAVTQLLYDETATYSENDAFSDIPVFNSFQYVERYRVSGTGINLKAGAIVKPVDWFRIGVAIHTPTWYGLDETYSNSLRTNLDFGSFSASSPSGAFEYNLNAPWRFNASLGFVILKYGMIGAEYELVDYSDAALRPSSLFFVGPNAFIDSVYVTTHSFKVGGEFRWDPFRIRAGYAMYMNPFNGNSGLDATMQYISGGVGYRSKKWFSLDLAYIAGISNGRQMINRNFAGLEPAQISNLNHNFVITFGVTF